MIVSDEFVLIFLFLLVFIIDFDLLPNPLRLDFFTDLTKPGSTVTNVTDAEPETKSFGYERAKVEASYRRRKTSISKVSTNTYTYVSILRINRHHSIGNQTINLTDEAKSVLEAKDYVGFFKDCGPSYITSIGRALEITAVFKFNSFSEHVAEEFAGELESYIRLTGVNATVNTTITSTFNNTVTNSTNTNTTSASTNSTLTNTTYTNATFTNLTLVDETIATARAEFSKQSKYSFIEDSLEIVIYGYGLKLDPVESEMMVVSSLEEYNEALYTIMENSQYESLENAQLGMVYEFEVEPFVDNGSFQNVTNLNNNTIDLPIPQSSINKAHRNDDPNDTDFDNTARANFICSDTSFKIDKYGYCCESSFLYDRDLESYIDTNESERLCRPLEAFETSLVKENMAINGEFVGRLDLAMRHRLNQLASLEQCISAASLIPKEKDYNTLRAQNGANDTIDFTLAELKKAIDPNSDYGLLKHMSYELDEYMDMFQAPCLNALSGSNLGIKPNVDNDFFMTHKWDNHTECMQTSCLSANTRWNRAAEGGCIPSVITGPTADAYDENDDSKCTKDMDFFGLGNNEVCRYSTSALNTFHTKATTCWNQTISISSIDDVMNAYCSPQITTKKVNSLKELELKGKFALYCPSSLLRRRRFLRRRW